MVTMRQALKARDRLLRSLRQVSYVNGVGISWNDDGVPCVRVNVEPSSLSRARREIDKLFEGVKVQLEPVDVVRSWPQEPQKDAKEPGHLDEPDKNG